MVAYIDSSVVLRHILLGDIAIEQALTCPRVVSSELLEIECRRVIQRERLLGHLDDTGLVLAVRRLEKVLAGISLMRLSEEIKKRAMAAFPVIVKALDALHLASAEQMSISKPDEVIVLFSYDAAMNRCAQTMGFAASLA